MEMEYALMESTPLAVNAVVASPEGCVISILTIVCQTSVANMECVWMVSTHSSVPAMLASPEDTVSKESISVRA